MKSEMGVRLGQWLVAHLEVPEPRLGAHADRDPMLNEEICCWIYTINLSERHLPMAMRVRSGTSLMCMAMALPKQRESVPTSSGANLNLAAPTHLDSALRRVMTMEALTKRRP